MFSAGSSHAAGTESGLSDRPGHQTAMSPTDGTSGAAPRAHSAGVRPTARKPGCRHATADSGTVPVHRQSVGTRSTFYTTWHFSLRSRRTYQQRSWGVSQSSEPSWPARTAAVLSTVSPPARGSLSRDADDRVRQTRGCHSLRVAHLKDDDRAIA